MIPMKGSVCQKLLILCNVQQLFSIAVKFNCVTCVGRGKLAIGSAKNEKLVQVTRSRGNVGRQLWFRNQSSLTSHKFGIFVLRLHPLSHSYLLPDVHLSQNYGNPFPYMRDVIISVPYRFFGISLSEVSMEKIPEVSLSLPSKLEPESGARVPRSSCISSSRRNFLSKALS